MGAASERVEIPRNRRSRGRANAKQPGTARNSNRSMGAAGYQYARMMAASEGLRGPRKAGSPWGREDAAETKSQMRSGVSQFRHVGGMDLPLRLSSGSEQILRVFQENRGS